MTDPVKSEAADARKYLALATISGFFIICVLSYGFMDRDQKVESWVAGIIGAVLGYWANSAASVLGWYFGGSATPEPKTSVTTLTKGAPDGPTIQQTTTTGPAQTGGGLPPSPEADHP